MSQNPMLTPAPGRLEGERVVVRPYTDEDALPLYEAVVESTEHLRPWMAWYRAYQAPDDALAYIRRCQAQILLREGFYTGMFLKEDGRFLGGTGYHINNAQARAFEIGYWIRGADEGKGYVTEAVILQTHCAFRELDAQRLMIRCDARNERSRRIPERLGYVFEGRLRCNEVDTSGEIRDTLVYSMIPEDYERFAERY